MSTSKGHHKRDDSQSSYYFVSHEAGTSESVRDAGDERAVIEEMPFGANPASFSPRAVNSVVSQQEHANAFYEQ